MNAAYHVRRATLNDVDDIAAAHRDSIHSIGARFYSPDVVAAWSARVAGDLYANAMADGEIFFIAVDDEDGMVLGFSSYHVDEGEHRTAVYVRGSAARRGVGSALFHTAEAAARAAGASSIFVASSLAAERFYRANGFDEAGRGQHPIGAGRSMGCVFMRKKLDRAPMSARTPIDRSRVAAQLVELGVTRGGVLVVHTAFSRIGPIEGGPHGLIDALEAALGPEGTLVMPSMSDDDDHPFDPARTPSAGMGIVADTFWRRPGVLRSDSPHAFAAKGPQAAAITAPHPVEVPHGLDSPVGRVYEMDGHVLLLGVGHDANTTIHLAETMERVRYKLPKYAMVLEDGRPTRIDYDEIDHCCENFALMDQWLDAAQLQRRGAVGHGEARLIRSRAIVETALAKLRANEAVFLHPPGVDAECDAARASIAGR